MSGYIGRWIIALSRKRFLLRRITALDPAKPMFYTNYIYLPICLSARDASVVDFIIVSNINFQAHY